MKGNYLRDREIMVFRVVLENFEVIFYIINLRIRRLDLFYIINFEFFVLIYYKELFYEFWEGIL